jgi:CDP-glycerol glycerophosphotransferase (TagB/SpsB family)
MKISVIALIDNTNVAKLDDAVNLLKKQSIKYENIEMIIYNNINKVDTQSNETLASLASKHKLKVVTEGNLLSEVTGEYVSFFDVDCKIDVNFFASLVKTCEDKKVDFASANAWTNYYKPIVNQENILWNRWITVSAAKVIKKHVLIEHGSHLNEQLTREKIIYFNYELYKLALPNEFLANVKYKYDVDIAEHKHILANVHAITYVIDHLIRDNQENIDLNTIVTLIKNILFIADKKLFLDDTDTSVQRDLLHALKRLQALENYDPNLSSNVGYKGFNMLVETEAYDEAIQYMKLFRSKRYWYERSQSFEAFFEKNPNDLKKSLSWKVTEPLRIGLSTIESVQSMLMKVFIVMLAMIVRIVSLNKEIWLVGERADQAEDNGYYFFKYCREMHPSKKIYYVINRNSPHLHKVEQYGNVLYHSSLKHRIYMLAASKYISAWTFEECSYPNPKAPFINMFEKRLKKKQHICLQHGVIIQNISPYLHKDVYHQNLVVCSSEKEKELMKTTLGYSEDELVVTGLARFDQLHGLTPKKQIVIMPTWRRHLMNVSETAFRQTDYYRAYKTLITDSRFLELVEKQNIQVKFYMHSQMQKYMDAFSFVHPNVEFLTKDKENVSTLLKESALLITDYSSVSLDFLYMQKPVVFYQFDPQNNHHIPSDEIKYSDIGNVVDKHEQVITLTQDIVNRQFETESEFMENSESIFKYRDKNNCKRIYDAITNLK